MDVKKEVGFNYKHISIQKPSALLKNMAGELLKKIII